MKKQFIVKLCLFIMLGISTYSSTLNFDDLNGGGKFINAKGGVISSPNNIPFTDVLGKMYMSDDFAEGDTSKVIITDSVLSTLKFSGVTIADSPYYVASPILNPITHELSLELTSLIADDNVRKYLWSPFYRVDVISNSVNNPSFKLVKITFKDDIKDKNIANYIEVDGDSETNPYIIDLYGNLKKITDKNKVNASINTMFGSKVFPLLTKQNFDSISNMNIENLDNVAKFDDSMEIGEVRANGTYNTEYTKIKGIYDFTDYKGEGNIASFWVEKKISENFKIGTVNSLSDSSFSMSPEDAYRDDMFVSSGVYGVYKKHSVIYTSTLSLGGNYSHLDRYNTSTIGDFRNHSTNESYFVGSNNSISRRFDLTQSYITPKVELNAVGLYQDKIKESGNYGLTIDDQATLSVEPGIGVEIGKDFYVNSKHKFILSTGVMNYLEVANPYQDKKAKMENLGTKKYKIEKYDNDRFKMKLSLKEGYNFTDRLGIYLNQDYTISKRQDQFKYGANLIFVF